jgi:hypothetical protein
LRHLTCDVPAVAGSRRTLCEGDLLLAYTGSATEAEDSDGRQ